jgi:predicted dehydrogenase/threonine dehydrogenase-like Zn-dependent dehydrogenase
LFFQVFWRLRRTSIAGRIDLAANAIILSRSKAWLSNISREWADHAVLSGFGQIPDSFPFSRQISSKSISPIPFLQIDVNLRKASAKKMIQLLQNFRNGMTEAVVTPCPATAGGVLVRTHASLISAGTERMLIEFGKANWIEKARQQPERVRMVVDKARVDGLLATFESVQAKLDQPIPLGYSNAGVVLASGVGINEFQPGDRVVTNGPHAEVVRVARNLCAKIPDGVSDDAAAFTVVASIALQGIRLAEPTLGECFAVTGLGLIGLITVQILRAQGCRVLGIDFDRDKLALAASFGAETVDLSRGEDPIRKAEMFSRGRGLDGVLIAAATQSNDPVHQAALMCRKRGRIVLIGVSGLELSRDDFYKKELTFQVSCSYGPGRYDSAYESGQDYPCAFVRWTAQRNFEAVLDMMACRQLQVEPMITHRFPFDRALDAYQLLGGNEPYLGILLQYAQDKSDEATMQRDVTIRLRSDTRSPSGASVGFIGAGGYAHKILIPSFRRAGAHLVSIASSGGLSAAHAGRKFGFEVATSDVDSILANPAINTVVIATRHDSHSALVCQALQAGKHVFVEKPLALKQEQLDQIEETWRSLPAPQLLMVGFNRRFAPQVIRIRELLNNTTEPKAFVYVVNAGSTPGDHWTQDPKKGGGRIAGEACHFIDLLRFLAGSPIKSIQTARQSSDTVTITITYEDSSIGTIHYFATGHKSIPKERLEVFVGGRVLILDNFRKLTGYGWPGFNSVRLWRQDKGAKAMAAAFVQAIRTGGPSPIPFDEILEISRATLKSASL